MAASSIAVGEKSIISTNKKRTNRATFISIILLILLMVFYYYYNAFYPTVEGELNVVAIISTALCNLIIFLAIFYNKKVRYTKLSVLIALFLLSCGLSYIVNGSGLHKILTLSLLLEVLYLCVKYPINKTDAVKIFYIFALAVCCVLLNTSTTDDVLSTKFNPNGGGFLATVLYCASFVLYLFDRRTNRGKYRYLIICMICIYLQFVFKSRTALLGIILFTISIILFKATKKTFKPRTVIFVLFLLACLGVVFAYCYAEILYYLVDGNSFVIFGKNIFTGREEIWHHTFESIKNNLFFGAGGRLNEAYAKDDARMMAVHNQPLGVLAEEGVFAFITFYLAVASIVALAYRKSKQNGTTNRIVAIYMAVTLIMSFFDSYFTALYNSLPIMIVFSVLVSCCVRNNT